MCGRYVWQWSDTSLVFRNNKRGQVINDSISLCVLAYDYICEMEQFLQAAEDTRESLADGRAHRPIFVPSLFSF